jgi:hypothetical protein
VSFLKRRDGNHLNVSILDHINLKKKKKSILDHTLSSLVKKNERTFPGGTKGQVAGCRVAQQAVAGVDLR